MNLTDSRIRNMIDTPWLANLASSLPIAAALALLAGCAQPDPARGASTPGLLAPIALRCQSAVNPLGIDVARPALSWKLSAPAEARGKRQTAYQVLVATSLDPLGRNEGDLWDSGKVMSDETLQIGCEGQPLQSCQQVFWKVRVWDEQDLASSWSTAATWTLGVLAPEDWKGAKWISDAELLKHERPALGYRSQDAPTQDTVKWLQLDLGTDQVVEEVRLRALRYVVAERLGFPRRFQVELSATEDFSNATVIADYWNEDFRNAWASKMEFKADNIPARFVRITANRLRDADGVYCLAFSQVEVISGGRNVAAGCSVTASDSLAGEQWSPNAVVDGMDVPDANPLANSTLLVRRQFSSTKAVRRALMHVSGLGQYDLLINGQRSGDAYLQPAWSQYGQTAFYDTHDITRLLHTGSNSVGLVLAGGFYNAQGGRYVKLTTPFRPLTALALIHIEYEDGTSRSIVTDEQWQVRQGPITFCNVFGGEDLDARLPGFAAADWRAAVATDGPRGTLRGAAFTSPPILEHGVLKPVAAREVREGVSVYDLGQNVSLMIRLQVRGPEGSTVKILPAELVNEDGSADRGSVGGGEASWNYTMAGRPDGETWEPRFFYHGARYLEVRRSPAEAGGELPVVEDLVGVMVHSDSSPAGEFECSNELFNRIRTVIRWAQRSNMAHVLTDCPHRERLGWLEQYHLHGPSLRCEWDLDRLYAKTFQDMADAQTERGLVPDIAPEYVVFPGAFRDSPEWGSAAVLVPWQHYEWTGNLEPLRQHFEVMRRYVDYLGSTAKDHIVSHGLGDWYDIGPNPPGYAQLTPIPLTATAFYYEDARVVAQTARLLGNTADAAKYHALAGGIRAAFNREFFKPDEGRYATGSQTAQAIPLVMGLVEPGQRVRVTEAMVRDIQQSGLTAGDIGHRYLLRALADAGRSDVVFDLHTQTNKPGYGYILNSGATSLTEAWDARRSSSQNHFMLGHITEWFYHDLAGIQPDPAGPGFRRVIIRPTPVGDVSWVKARYDAARGPIGSAWKRDRGTFELDVEIPPNVTASVHLPSDNANRVTESGRPVDRREDVKIIEQAEGGVVIEVGSGRYRFRSPL